jgi:hypothetical protein
MKQEIEIKVPTSWSAVTLEKYLKLQKDMEIYKDEEGAYTAILFHHLCEFPVELITKIDVDTYSKIKRDLAGFLNSTELPLQRIITLDGIEYGFEPNLSQMSYGAYVDISKYETLAIDDKWSEIMSILYRPVTKKQGKLYDIQTYKGEIDKEKFLNVGMDVHFGALFFFKNLLMDLLSDIQKSLMQSPEIPHNIKLILERNGNLIRHFTNLPKVIS